MSPSAACACRSSGVQASRNFRTCCGHRPIYSRGSISCSSSDRLSPKTGSPASRSSRSQGRPSFMRFVAAIECLRMTSCSCCRSPPRFTASIIRSSVARNGRYSRRVRFTIASLTCRPAVTFWHSRSTASMHKKPSGMAMRRFAESSSVRSSHWTEAVIGAFIASAII